MKTNLLFVAALTLAGGVFAQDLKLSKSVDHKATKVVANTASDRGMETRASIFSHVFTGPGLGPFTATWGATSTAPHWAYVAQEEGATCFVQTNAQSQSTFDEYLTVTDAIAIPDPAVDGDVYRLQVDMGVDYGWLNSARGGMGDLKIQLSNDNGATWTDFWFEENATMLRNTFTSYLPEYDGTAKISPIINIPNAYRVADFKFRISLTGTNTADQVVYGASVYSVPVDYSGIAINFVYNADIINDFDYGRIALSQVKPITAGLLSTNIGLTATTKDVSFILRKNDVQVHEESTTITYPLLKCDTTYHELSYTPDGIGFYTLVAVVSGDGETVRDSIVFEVTEYSQSHSTIDDLEWITSRSTLAGFVSQFAIENDAEIFGANAYLWSNTTVGQNMLVMIHVYNGNSWGTEYTGEFTISASDLSSNSGLRRLYIPFEYGVAVYEGDIIRLEIRKESTGTVGILAKGGDNDHGSLIYGDFGSAGLEYYGGVGYSYGLELDFQDRLSIAAVEGMENVTVYPNPSNGVVNISNTANEVLSVSVKNIAGQEVATTSVFGNGSIDLGNFGAGVYVFEISNGTSRSTKRVIVK